MSGLIIDPFRFAAGDPLSGGIFTTYVGDGTNGILGTAYKVRTFDYIGATDVLSVTEEVVVELLVLGAGAGSGGASNTSRKSGSGGAGKLYYSAAFPLTPGDYTIEVGLGGALGGGSTYGGNGGDTIFGPITCPGGGGGAPASTPVGTPPGSDGGCGGGGAANNSTAGSGGAELDGTGGELYGTFYGSPGGSGAAGSSGGHGGGTNGGLITGRVYYLSGSAVEYGIGGTYGGANPTTPGSGGPGVPSVQNGRAGTDGIVIVRYV